MDRLDVMTLFARVVETGSFSRAAEECGIGQPTASKQVAALEKRLGVRLLERSTRRLRATEAGQEYYQGCRRMLDEMDDIETRVGAGVQAMAGRLRVACPMAFGRMYVAPVVIGFMAAYPLATVDLVMDDRYVDLVEQGADLSIRIANLEPDSLLHARRLGDGPRAIVGAPAYLRRHGTPREPEELARHAFAVYANFQDPETLRLRRGDEQREARIRASLRVNNAEVMLAAARAGLALSVLPLWCAAEDLQRGTLRRVLPAWQPPASGIWAVYASARHQPLRVRSFLDYLAQRLVLPG
jgi:DNA-binding transcriptional LysR family regulator